MNSFLQNDSSKPAYIQLYNYFRELILSGAMKSESKLPSIRKCAEQFSLSKTTVESAYVQLEAEGYIYSVPQSGFYVSAISNLPFGNRIPKSASKVVEKDSVIYDFTSSSADENSFDFKLWQRYIKSALRTGERLLSYGDPQGEEDLRKALCAYVSRSRGIICNESQIVIGAGVQNLLQLLCALEKDKKSVLFLGKKYPKGEQIFEDYGKEVFSNELYEISENTDIIYTSPSHINDLGDVLPAPKRIELIKYARENSCLIIEDDFDSEFSYTGYPIPALQSLDGGENVVYIGSFSKLLLPSIRISFLILTPKLAQKYSDIIQMYNQTASKTEQIALCRYITDGHLYLRIKKTKKLYAEKTKLFYCELKKYIDNVSLSSSGFLVSIKIEGFDLLFLEKEFLKFGMKIKITQKEAIVFSVFSISSENIQKSAQKVVNIVKNLKKE